MSFRYMAYIMDTNEEERVKVLLYLLLKLVYYLFFGAGNVEELTSDSVFLGHFLFRE